MTNRLTRLMHSKKLTCSLKVTICAWITYIVYSLPITIHPSSDDSNISEQTWPPSFAYCFLSSIWNCISSKTSLNFSSATWQAVLSYSSESKASIVTTCVEKLIRFLGNALGAETVCIFSWGLSLGERLVSVSGVAQWLSFT
jgi:hypothetical protein